MKHLKKAFCLLLAAVMLLALGVPVMAAGEIPVDAEHFPDAALRTYVTDYCDTNKDNKLSAAECEAVQCIDLFEMKITKVADMTGIEHFTNLRELLACNNQITTLDLSGMTKLEKLDVSGCDKLQSLKLAGCTALTSLDASSCALTALDLTGCTALKTVACSYNDLTALDVSAAEKLTTLECSANRLTALDLSGHNALKVLTCSLNDLAALELTLHRARVARLQRQRARRARPGAAAPHSMPPRRATARPQTRSSARSTCRSRPAPSRTGSSAPCTWTPSSARTTSAALRACRAQTTTSRPAPPRMPRRRTISPISTTPGARPAVHGRVF